MFLGVVISVHNVRDHRAALLHILRWQNIAVHRNIPGNNNSFIILMRHMFTSEQRFKLYFPSNLSFLGVETPYLWEWSWGRSTSKLILPAHIRGMGQHTHEKKTKIKVFLFVGLNVHLCLWVTNDEAHGCTSSNDKNAIKIKNNK